MKLFSNKEILIEWLQILYKESNIKFVLPIVVSISKSSIINSILESIIISSFLDIIFILLFHFSRLCSDSTKLKDNIEQLKVFNEISSNKFISESIEENKKLEIIKFEKKVSLISIVILIIILIISFIFYK